MADAMTSHIDLRFDIDQSFNQPSGTGRGRTANKEYMT
jgi:hypothetical protein